MVSPVVPPCEGAEEGELPGPPQALRTSAELRASAARRARWLLLMGKSSFLSLGSGVGGGRNPLRPIGWKNGVLHYISAFGFHQPKRGNVGNVKKSYNINGKQRDFCDKKSV